mmetsp:Transcript_146720/g.269513  ORF Transcript_146720/g.269513 Transcript_146720/m.269513 type:complete len:128 (+) Transcript_146720:2-385(+)
MGSATFTMSDLDGTDKGNLADVGRAAWNKYIDRAFDPETADELKDYWKKCRGSFKIMSHEGPAIDVEGISELMEGCDDEPQAAFEAAFGKDNSDMIIATVNDGEELNGYVIAAKRDDFVFSWVSVMD